MAICAFVFSRACLCEKMRFEVLSLTAKTLISYHASVLSMLMILNVSRRDVTFKPAHHILT